MILPMKISLRTQRNIFIAAVVGVRFSASQSARTSQP
jgi:hypothetical protein